MSNLKRQIRDVSKQGTQINAVVVDVHGNNRASVKLSTNGALVRNLRVVGGPVGIGSQVQVEYTGPEPTIVATSKTWVSAEDLARALASIRNRSGRTNFVWQILRFSGGVLAEHYSPDISGFGSAIQDAGEGDTILLPPGETSGDPTTVPSGVCIAGVDHENSILNAELTLSDKSKLSGFSLAHRSSSEDVIGVIGPSSGTAYIDNCNIMAFGCGSNNATAMVGAGSGVIEVDNSLICGDSINGNGYGVDVSGGGTVKLYHTTYYAKTTDFTGTNIQVYSTTETSTRITCPGEVLPNCRNTYNWAIQLFSESFGMTQNIPESVTSMTPTKFLNNVLADDPLLSTNYVYMWIAASICTRYRVSDGGEDSVIDIGDDKYWQDSNYSTNGWCLYNEDTGYACVVDDTTYPNRTWSLIKLDFLTGLPTTLLSWAEREAISGGYRYNRPYLIRYNDTLLIIDVTMTQIGTDPYDGEIRVRKFDIATEEVTFTSSYVATSPDPNNYHYQPFYLSILGAHDEGVPHLLGDTLVYPIKISDIFDDAGSPPGSSYNASVPLLIFDVGDETISMKFWLTTDDDPDIFHNTGWDGVGHKTYLFLTYGVNESNNAGLLEYALDTDTFTLKQYWTSSSSKSLQFFQGKNGVKVVWLDMSPSPDVINIKDNPTDWNTVEQFDKPPYLLASYMGIWDDGGSNACWLYEEDGTTAVILSGYNPTTDTTREITISGLTRVTAFDAFLGSGYFLLRTQGVTAGNSDWYIAR